MAKKKYMSFDEFLNQNPDQRVQKEQKVFLETTLNNKVNLGPVPEVVPGLPVDSGVPAESPQTNINPRVRQNKNRGGKRNLRKFKKVEEEVVRPRRKPISLRDFRFPYEVDGVPGDISAEELARARSLLPKQQSLNVAQSVSGSNGKVVNASGQEVVSPRRGKNRGGRGSRGRMPTPHISEMSHAQPAIQLGEFFSPEKIVSKNGKIRYVNPFNKKEVIYTVGKNGRPKSWNSKFVFDPFENLVRLANPNESFDSIQNLIWHSGAGAETDAMYHFFPAPKHGAPISTPPSIYDAYGEGVSRPLTISERAAFDHRQKMRKKYNSKKRPSYNTRSTRAERQRKKAAGVFDYGEDVGNTFNIERRRHTVGRFSGSVEQYKAKVASYIKELETELSYLDAGSGKKTRKIIIQDILSDLRKELNKTADQINPTKTGLPHKLELKVIKELKGEGQILNRMVGDVADLSRDARFVSNKIALNEITNMQIPDRIYSSEISHMQKVMIKADVMQDKLPKSVIARHLKDKDFMNSYMKGGRLDEYVLKEDGSLDFNHPRKAEVRLRRPDGRIKVGESVKSDRKAAAEAERLRLKAEYRAQKAAEREAQQAAIQAARDSYKPSFVRRVEAANQASATISSTPMPGSSTMAAASDSVTRAGSRVASMLGEDTVRAASVIHSSKLNYAAVGLAGMAAVFGIASAGRQRKNVEQEIQSRF